MVYVQTTSVLCDVQDDLRHSGDNKTGVCEMQIVMLGTVLF